MEHRNSTANRFRYGICLNEDCPKCKEKEVQKIPMRKEFVCGSCQQDLRECPPPPDPKDLIRKIAIIVFVVLAVAAIGVGLIFLIRDLKAKKELERIEQMRRDSIARVEADSIATIHLREVEAAQKAKAEAAEQARRDSIANAEKNNSIIQTSPSNRLEYGAWSGTWKNGKPNGQGTLRYTKEHLIDPRDPQKRIAKKGDYIIGEFVDGKLVQGRWYDSANNVKGSIIIGM